MSKDEKLIRKLFVKPKDFTDSELRRLMASIGFIEDNKGNTSGSRVAFVHPESGLVLRIHKPHPGNELKSYQIKISVEFFESMGYKNEKLN